VLDATLALSERERARFLEEAERMQRVEHAGLIALRGSGLLSDGRPYICMPWLQGETLATRLHRGALPLATTAAIFDVLADAVTALHRVGLIHRDIKPENIFLESSEEKPRPVLLDFGIARDVAMGTSTTTASGRTRGTPAYMAPERFFGTPASIATDVYELGVTLYLMLVGRLPWDQTNDATSRLSPIHPSDLGAKLPPKVVEIVLRALSTRPEARPASAESFASAVRGAVEQLPEAPRKTQAIPVAGPASPDARASRSMGPFPQAPRRRIRGMSLTAMVIAMGLVGLAAVLYRAPLRRPAPIATEPLESMASGTVDRWAEGPKVVPVTLVPATASADEEHRASTSPPHAVSRRAVVPPSVVVVAAPAAPSADVAVVATEGADKYYRDRK
jgi:eukaryotic-like serine/threonine-protein kinase